TVARMNASPFSPSNYDHRDLVPIGYAAFAFALGVTAGVLIRRTLPAMAATLVAFIGVRFAFLTWVLPHLNTPLRATTPFYAQPGVILGSAGYARGRISSADWVISEQTINGMGQVVGKNGGFGPNGSFGANVSPTTGGLTLSDGQACPTSIRVPGPSRALGNGPPGHAVTNAIHECV